MKPDHGTLPSLRDDARESYSVWRATHAFKATPAAWADLDEHWKDAFTTVYFLGRLDQQELNDRPEPPK